MSKTLRVGIIGASAKSGWAKDSHVPAIQKLGGLELVAVASSNQASANAAAQSFGAKSAYASGAELIRDPDVDLVSIAVKVPDHRELVLAALSAGKHVYCEWPLGRNVAESEEMAAAARKAGVHVAIGLQTRANPAARGAIDQIQSGTLGRLLSARVYSTAAAFGSDISDGMRYAERPENGVTLVSIQGAHTIDIAIALLGPLEDVSALASTQFPNITVGEEKIPQTRITPDHLIAHGRTPGGVPLSVEVAGGRPSGATPFLLEVIGEKSTLSLRGGADRGFQSDRLSLSIDGKRQSVDEGETAPMPEAAVNVAGHYATLRDDIERDTTTVVDFDYAVKLSRLIDDLLASSSERQWKTANQWPG